MYFEKERINRLLEELKGYIYPLSIKIQEYLFREGEFEGAEKTELDTSRWIRLNAGDRWGGKDKHFWFRTRIEIPSAFDGREVIFTVRTGVASNIGLRHRYFYNISSVFLYEK